MDFVRIESSSVLKNVSVEGISGSQAVFFAIHKKLILDQATFNGISVRQVLTISGDLHLSNVKFSNV